jgi:hypothetical protein
MADFRQRQKSLLLMAAFPVVRVAVSLPAVMPCQAT